MNTIERIIFAIQYSDSGSIKLKLNFSERDHADVIKIISESTSESVTIDVSTHTNINGMSDHDIGRIFECPKLISFYLNYDSVDSACIKKIAAALTKSTLSELYLCCNEGGNDGAKEIAAILKGSTLTKLYLRGNKIECAGAVAIAAALSGSSLTELNLGSNDIGNEGARAIGLALANSGTSLTKLHLQHNKIGYEGIAGLCAVLPDSRLTVLDLRNNHIGCKGVEEIIAILPNSLISKLDLSFGKIGPEGIQKIAAMMQCPSNATMALIDLDWSANEIEYEGIVAIMAALEDYHLTRLCLRNNRIKFMGGRIISEILSLTRLVTLDLGYNNINNRTAALIIAGSAGSSLTDLDLSSNYIECEGIDVISAELCKSSLLRLNLSGNNIQSRGSKSIFAGLEGSSITFLDLSDNQIGDGVRDHSLKFSSSLQCLQMENNEIHFEEVKEIISEFAHSSLQKLHIDCEEISNDDMLSLAEIIRGTLIIKFVQKRCGREIRDALRNALKENKANLELRRFKKTKVATSV